MKITVIGPQNTGKAIFIRDFLENFNEYATSKKTYRDVITDKKLPINQKTAENSQRKLEIS